MKIKLEEAVRIYEKYGAEDVPLIFLSDIYLNTGAGVLQLTQGMKFDDTQYDMLIRSNIYDIDVVFTEKLLAKLIATFPNRYRYPLGRKSMLDIDRIISDLEDANRMSRRKRYVLSRSEVYKKNANEMYEVILRYGEKLTYARWNEVKVKLGRSAQIDYRLDEVGIAIFIILKVGHPDYMKRFMMNTELISLIVEHKTEFDLTIAPDFDPENDIYPINDKSDLLQTYSDKKVKMVIVGGELDEEYKLALAQLKRYDRYARMMVVKNPDPAKKKEILMMIKRVYNQNLWEKD